MKRFTLILSLMVAMVTTAMAQKAHQRVSHEGWVVTALNEAGVYGNEGGVAFIADDNAATYYHSNWSSNYEDGNEVNKGCDGLQAFMVDLSTSLSDLSLITYKGRSDNRDSGWARGVRVYVYETLPTGWPANGLSSLSYTEKEALLSKDNANLGTAAFDNTGKLWANDQTQKLVEFTTPQTGRYVLFIMERGHDNWLTCSDFQIYQLKDYTAIKENNSYFLQVINAAAEGIRYVDTKTANSDTSGPTIGVSETAVETYFDWNENGWFIKDTEGKYIGVSKWFAGPQQETGYEWQLLVNDDNTLNLLQTSYDGGEDNSRCFLGGDVTTNADKSVLYTDNAKDKAINVKLIDASAVPVTVKYVFTLNGVEKRTQTTETFSGELYPEVDFELPFGVAATKPDGKIDAKEAVDGVITKTIVLENTLPFAFADSYEKINKWYYIQMHSSGGTYSRFLQYAETYIEWADVTRTTSENDTYTWGFIGDPFTGFKLVNYGAPTDAKAVVSASDSGNPGFGAIADAVAWNIKASRTDADSEHFCFQYPGSSNYMNAQSGKVSFWWDNDNGSTMWVTERDMTGLADLQALIGQVEAAIAAYGQGGTTVGYYTAESTAALAAALAEAKAAAEANTSAAANTAAQVSLQNAVAALKTIQPVEGKFYYIASAMPSTDARGGQKMYVNNDGAMQFQNAETLGNVFQFVPAGDNAFYLYNVERGTYLNTAKGHNGGQATAVATTGSVKVSVANMGRENVVSIIPNGGAMLHAQASGSQVVAWNNTDNAGASAWIISEVADITELSHELTVGEAGYATLYLGYNAAIPAIDGEDCGVFTAAIVDGYAAMTKVEGVLPANTAVIVKAVAGSKYNFKYATGEAATIENNELKGTTINANITEDAYVLGYINVAEEGEEERKEVGLYTATKNKLDGTAWLNNAFKAYLPMTDGMNAASYSFRFGEGTTGVENVEVESGVNVIYDLTGRRVEAITASGIYIVNGKKTLVK